MSTVEDNWQHEELVRLNLLQQLVNILVDLLDAYPSSVIVADSNNDKDLGLVVINNGTHTICIRQRYGNGTFIIETNYSTGIESTPFFIAITDLNKDNC